MELNDSISDNFTRGFTGTDYSIVKLSSLVPGWSTVTLIIFIVISMLIGLPGNSLVLIVVPKVKRKTSTDWFIIFIAACDLISLSVSGTLYILFFTPEVWTAISSEFVCKFHYYIIHCVFLQSLLLITCMGLDRYIKTCRPHSVLFTPKIALRCCVTITTVSFLYNISQIFTTKLNIYGECALDSTKAALQISVYGFTFVVVLLCSGAVCIMYAKIAIKIRGRVKVAPYVDTNTGLSSAVNKYRNDTIVPLRSRENCGTVTQRHATVSYPEVEKIVSIETISSKYDTNHDSGMMEQTESTSKVTHMQTKQLFDSNIAAKTSLRHQVNENQRIRANVACEQGDHSSRKISKTSKTMGAITLVFFISTVIPAFAVGVLSVTEDIKRDPVARVIVFLVTRLYLINNFSNPLFYIFLSSEFRKKAIETLSVCKMGLLRQQLV